MTMIWNIRRGLIFRVTVFSFLCWCGAAQRRARFCESLLNCFDSSLLCPVLFGYYNCTDFNIARNTEPACGESRVTGRASLYAMPRVVNGVDAEEREFPWTVNVEDEESLIGMCGGSIIRKDVILTAAHCVRSLVRRPKSLRIGYGSTRLSRLVYVRASRISVHPDYNQTNGDNDIAVVVLNEALPLNTNLRSICLPEAGASYDSNSRCIIAGWGILNENGNRFPGSLQKAAVPLVPRNSCQRAYSNNPYILVSERQVCAGYYGTGGVDACTGDSGGPLICPDGDKWVVYGVVSRGYGCGRALYPGVYAYVPQYIDWITSQMN
ncbi:trypsin Blo t 3-like [Haliotis rufescens]|uniref:trypsin Blo t 3-like n=1 Tax=Haliotis rufescens TaxID=6454 RepID=UPI00201F0E6A|nr:trypsin Blo t 3-like [Haliotis rufescens]